MNKILSLGGRLNKLIERTEEEAEEIIARAQSEADEIVSTAQSVAKQMLQRAQRRSGLNEFLKDAEEEAKVEAKKVLQDYTKRAEEIRSIQDSELRETSKILVKEVMSHE